MTDSKQIVDEIYEKFTDIVGFKTITTANIIYLSVNLMQLVERYPDIKGKEKKAIVLDILKKYISDYEENEETEKSLLLFIDTVLPSTIDTMVSLDRSELVIKLPINSLFACCK